MTGPTERELAEYYSRKADDFDELRATYLHPNWYRRAFYGARFNAVFASLDPKQGERVLDVGSGPGYYAFHMAAAGAKVTCLDIARGYLRQIPRETAARVNGTAKSLPFRPDSFDKVLATEVLEHSSYPREILGEVARVLVPGGHAVITSPSKRSYMDRLYEVKFRLRRYAFREHLQELDRNTFLSLLRERFDVLRLQFVNCLIPYPLDLIAMRVPEHIGRPAFERLESDFSRGRGGPKLGWTMVALVERG